MSLTEIDRITSRFVFPLVARNLWDSLGIPYEPGWPENLPAAEFDRLVDRVTRALTEVLKEMDDEQAR